MGIKYKKNFLTTVVFRIDFSSILKLLTELPADFQEAIREDFSNYKEGKIIEVVTEIVNDQGSNSQNILENRSFSNWSFISKDESKKVTLCHNYLILEYFKYTNFEDFYKDIKKVFQSFQEIYKPIDIKRLGVRYINNIILKEGNAFDWTNLINSSLTSIINNFFDSKNEFSRVMSQITLNKEDFQMVFTYGLYNSEFPSRISRREFVLDYDCFTTDVTEQNVLDLTDKFHTQIGNYFEKSIEDELRGLMEVVT